MTKRDILFLRILEISWFIIAASSLFTSIDSYLHYGFNRDFAMFGILTIIAGGMFYLRLKKRKKLTQN